MLKMRKYFIYFHLKKTISYLEYSCEYLLYPWSKYVKYILLKTGIALITWSKIIFPQSFSSPFCHKNRAHLGAVNWCDVGVNGLTARLRDIVPTITFLVP